MAAATWLDRAKEAPLLDVAAELGLEYRRAGPSLSPCPNPACAAVELSGSNPGRGPVRLYPDHWHCFRCDAGRDGLDLVAYALASHRLSEAPAEDKGRVHAWYADRGWCDPAPGYAPRRPPPRPAAPRTVATAPAPKSYPPAAEVAALWAASHPVDRTLVDPDPREMWPAFYLTDRRLRPRDLAPLNVARVLPLAYPWPTWWPASWTETWRLVVRAFKPDGTLASLHARAVPEHDGDGRRLTDPQPKSRWPYDCDATGLLFADPAGLAMLRGEPPAGLEGVLVAEGLTDLLRCALVVAAEREPLAVLGAAAGGFRALRDVRLAPGLKVYAATDPDAAGDRYADQIRKALAPRPVYRYPLARRTT